MFIAYRSIEFAYARCASVVFPKGLEMGQINFLSYVLNSHV